MKKSLKVLLLFVATITILFGCNSTELISSWKSPNAKIQSYNKVLVIGLMGSKDPELRLNVEERIVAALKQKGIMAESAYTQYGPKAFENLNQTATTQKIKRDGYDSAFTIALLNTTKDKNYNPGRVTYEPTVYYNRFWRQFRTVYSRVYEPGYYTTSTNYILEANFYNLNQDMLLYSAQTKSFDPGSAQSLATSLSETLLNDMIKKGIITAN